MWLAGLTVVRRIGAAVPVWAWALAALLAWGGWQRHRAASAVETLRKHDAAIAAQIITKQQADAAETARRLSAQKAATDAAEVLARTARLDAAGARSAADQLRVELASRTADRRAADPAAAGGSEADRLADALGQCADRYRAVAEVADAAIGAGLTCQRSYQSLTTGEPAP